MLELSAEQQREFRSAVQSAAGRSDLSSAIAGIYADFALEIEKRKPICKSSGRCCKFAEFGHRLFITTGEMAFFATELQKLRRPNEIAQPSIDRLSLYPRQPRPYVDNPTFHGTLERRADDSCVFQSQNLCTVHMIRPFGCRVFFCDETAVEWQQGQYEQFHMRIRELHQQMHIPYFYVEWTRALAALALDSTGAGSSDQATS